MKKIIGGSISIVLGCVCLSGFFPDFLTVIAGSFPFIFILVGGLVIYLNHETASMEKETAKDRSDETFAARDEPYVSNDPPEAAAENQPPEKAVPDHPAVNVPRFSGNTGTLVFHRMDCKFSHSKKCTAVFNTREAALQDGYKPCGICSP